MPRKKRSSNPATDRILAAAGTMIARYGYAEATFEKIAKQAGVSRGLLHYHFQTKEQMFARVLARNLDGANVMLREIIEGADSAEALAEQMTNALARLKADNPNHFAVFLEGLGAARSSQIVRKELSRSYFEFRATLRDGLQDMIARGVISPTLPAPTIAVMFMSILDGLSLALATVAGSELGDDVWPRLKQGLRALLQ